jgi:hypothetical protein
MTVFVQGMSRKAEEAGVTKSNRLSSFFPVSPKNKFQFFGGPFCAWSEMAAL